MDTLTGKAMLKNACVSGSGTILLIEDDEMVLNIGRAIMERLGYRVLIAETGEKAVQIARTCNENIDLALLDIGLPDMTATDVFPAIKEARPKMKIIVCSGFTEDGPAKEILDAGAMGFIQKPFSIQGLSDKLGEALQVH